MSNFSQVLNTIRANASPTYQERVPVATQSNLSSVGAPILEYSDTMNEFLNSLVNRIGLTIITNREARNPLEILKKGKMPLGSTMQEIFTNPAKAKQYNLGSTGLLAQTTPDVKAAYYTLNRKNRYDVTLNRATMAQAFTSWENLEKLFSSIITSLYSGKPWNLVRFQS